MITLKTGRLGQGMSICVVLSTPVRVRSWPFMQVKGAAKAFAGKGEAARSLPREAPPMVITGITTFEVPTS